MHCTINLRVTHSHTSDTSDWGYALRCLHVFSFFNGAIFFFLASFLYLERFDSLSNGQSDNAPKTRQTQLVFLVVVGYRFLDSSFLGIDALTWGGIGYTWGSFWFVVGDACEWWHLRFGSERLRVNDRPSTQHTRVPKRLE